MRFYKEVVCKSDKTLVVDGAYWEGMTLTLRSKRFRWEGSVTITFDSTPTKIKVNVSGGWGLVHFKISEGVNYIYGKNSLASGLLITEIMHLYKSALIKSKITKRTYTKDILSDIDRWLVLYQDLNDINIKYHQFLKDEEMTTIPGIHKISQNLPGVKQVAWCPCECGDVMTVWEIVQHLNDGAGWNREKIADWIDYLQDNRGFDFTFKVADKPIDELGWKPLGYIKEEL